MKKFLEEQIEHLKKKQKICIRKKNTQPPFSYRKQLWIELIDLYDEHILDLEKVLKNITYTS